MGRRRRAQPQVGVPLLEGRAAGDDRARLRRDREHHVGQRDGVLRQRAVQRREGRDDQPHPQHGGALRASTGSAPSRSRRARSARRSGRSASTRSRRSSSGSSAGTRCVVSASPRTSRTQRPSSPRTTRPGSPARCCGSTAACSPATRRWRASSSRTSRPTTRIVLDILIRGGRVIDGAGNPWYRADVGIAGDRIAAVGRSPASRRRA